MLSVCPNNINHRESLCLKARAKIRSQAWGLANSRAHVRLLWNSINWNKPAEEFLRRKSGTVKYSWGYEGCICIYLILQLNTTVWFSEYLAHFWYLVSHGYNPNICKNAPLLLKYCAQWTHRWKRDGPKIRSLLGFVEGCMVWYQSYVFVNTCTYRQIQIHMRS